MNASLAAADPRLGLWTSRHQAVPLEGIRIHTELTLPVGITRQTQLYRNVLKQPIEARYVFPVPLDATLLELEIRIGSRVLHGVVRQKHEAEQRYENAIAKGDSAFLLTKLDDGLYQISLGNIMAGEQVELTVSWAETLRWNGQEIRYRLPNLVGEHYGNPQRAGIAPDNAPTHSKAVAYDFDLQILLNGDLATATVTSPNHPILATQTREGLQVRLDSPDWLDRSFTLIMHMATPPALVAWSAPDGDNLAVMACCYPPVPATNETARHVTLLVDGSGSMQGISIAQAREAACAIVKTLRDQDSCSIAAFGSSTQCLTPRPYQVGAHRDTLLAICRRLNADLGGTEMQDALERVMLITPEGHDILMITDGQVYCSDEDIRRFARHRRRLFTIGVGHSTSEKILRRLSEASGGFCELVSPNEDMAAHILSHFRRMNAPRLTPTYQWPGRVVREDAPQVVFGGDTAILSARLAAAPAAELHVSLPHADLRATLRPAEGQLAAMLPRLVAERLLPLDNIKLAGQEAEHYQLVTEHTSMIAVLERDQSPDSVELPVVVDVPQMDVLCDASVEYVRSSLCMSAPSSSAFRAPSRIRADSTLMSSRAADNTSSASVTWMLDLNAKIERGEDLATLLHFRTLPAEWQNAVTDIAAEWDEALLVLAILLLSLQQLSTAQLRQCRPLNRALELARITAPDLDDVISAITELDTSPLSENS